MISVDHCLDLVLPSPDAAGSLTSSRIARNHFPTSPWKRVTQNFHVLVESEGTHSQDW